MRRFVASPCVRVCPWQSDFWARVNEQVYRTESDLGSDPSPTFNSFVNKISQPSQLQLLHFKNGKKNSICLMGVFLIIIK